MGLIPPSFLLRAYKFAPMKIGQMSSGILSLRTRLTSLVMDSKSLFPASAAPIKFFRWHGFRPSGPPADPAGNDRMDFLTESDDTGICTSLFSVAGEREIPTGGIGCLSLSFSSVSLLSGARVSSDDSSRIEKR